MDDYEIVQSTGEVVEKPKFRSMWSNPFGTDGQDLSNEFEDVFDEVAPFAVDPKTGKLLNNSSQPKLVKTGRVNVHDRIQSFAKEVDLYSILEKFAYSGDPALINKFDAGYGDISDVPDNLNDLSQYAKLYIDKLQTLNPELGKMVIDENITAEEIEAKANEIYNARIEASKSAEGKGGNE